MQVTRVENGFIVDHDNKQYVFINPTSLAKWIAKNAVSSKKETAKPIESQDYYDIRILDHGPNKIGCIKCIREETGLGLADAKSFSESLPNTLQKRYTFADGERVASKFKDWGCRVEMIKV